MSRSFHVWLLVGWSFSLPRVCCGQQNLLEGDGSFETGYGVWNQSGAVDDTTAFDGQRSVRLTGRLATRERYRYKLAGGRTYTFSVYLKAKEPGTKLSLEAPRTNWSGAESQTVVTVGTEWKRYSLPVAPKPDTSPTVWLCIDHPAWLGQPERTYWVDACQFEEGVMTPYQSAEPISAACQVESPVPGNVFYPEEKVKLTFQLYNSRQEEAAATLRYDLRDYYGKTAKSETLPFRLPGQKNLSRQTTLDSLRRKGLYVVDYSLSAKAGDVVRSAVSFCIVAHPLPYSPEEGSPFGLSSAYGARVPAVARMGAKWTEARFTWPWLEKEQGKLEVDGLAHEVDYLNKHGINAIGRPERTAKWAGEYSEPTERALPKEEALPAYENFVFQVVSRLKGKVHYWMNWGGEDDLTVKGYAAKMGKSEDWVLQRIAEMMKAGYRGAKRADPNCVYGGAGQPSGVDCSAHFPFSRKVFTLAGDYTDMFHLDCYTWPRYFKQGWKVQSPEELKLTDILKEALAIAGPKKRCWIAEYGFGLSLNEAMDSPSAKSLADYMARSYLLAASVPRIEMLQWFASWECVEGESSYDMWRWPNPLPVVAAYSALAQVLTGAGNPREVVLGSSIKAYVFEKKKGSFAALWVPSNREVPVRLKQAKGVRVVDLMGNEVGGGATSLKLTGSPLYLLSKEPVGALRRLLAEARVDLKPVRVEIQLADLKTLRVQLANEINLPLNGTIALTVPLQGKGVREVQGSFTGLRPGVTEAVEVQLPGELDGARLSDCLLSGEVRTEEGTVKVTQPLSLLPCPKTDKKMVVDGDLADWAGRAPLELKDASYLAPPDALSHGLWTGEEDLSVRAYLAWDDERFYFAARVRDDILKNESGKENIWSGDSIQIGFDPQSDALKMKAPGYETDDREFSFGYSEKLNSPAICRSWPLPGAEPQAELAVKRQGDFILYELALPWKELGALRPERGKVFGFNFVVTDRDLGGGVEYWLGLTSGICDGKDPAAFRKFVLVEEQQKW
jgi:hypothetical protein